MCHVKITNVPINMRALGMIKKGTNKYIDKISYSPSLYEIQKKKKLHFTELLISLRE